MNAFWIALAVVAALAALYFWLLWPGRATAQARKTFARRAYAHRGLYDNEGGVPENSLPAFERAMQRGYGCELDVQFTRDKQLIVFHDNDFKRASGVDKKVWELTYDEILALPLFGTNERVPLFSEVLACVAGRNPLIVEIKAEGIDCPWYYEVCAAALAQLRGYRGDYCVESFHPMAVRWFRKNAPDIVRGQLVNGVKSSPNFPLAVSWPTAQLLTSFLTRPHFIAYKEEDRNRALRLSQKLGAMTVMWTVRTQSRYDQLAAVEDAIIFERFAPPANYEQNVNI